MLMHVMQHVAPLAECLQVRGGVVPGVMVQMRRREDNPGLASGLVQSGQGTQPNFPATVVPPNLACVIPPTAIPEVMHCLAMWSGTMLTTTLGPLESDEVGQLRPVDGVKPAVLRTDRHQLPALPAERAAGKYR